MLNKGSNPVRGILAKTRDLQGQPASRAANFPQSAPNRPTKHLQTVLLIGALALAFLLIPDTATGANPTRTVCKREASAAKPSTVHAWRNAYRKCQKRKLRHAWALVARCESGNRWAYNGASGFDGGLQFNPKTWAAYRRGISHKRFAWQATPHNQRRVAERVKKSQGLGAWPHCGKYYRG